MKPRLKKKTAGDKIQTKRIPWSRAAKFFKDGWTLERIIGGRHQAFLALIVKRTEK